MRDEDRDDELEDDAERASCDASGADDACCTGVMGEFDCCCSCCCWAMAALFLSAVISADEESDDEDDDDE